MQKGVSYVKSKPEPIHLSAYSLSEPLSNTTILKIEINREAANLIIYGLAEGQQGLASGTLQYLEKQGSPSRAMGSANSKTTLTLKGGGIEKSRFRLPWEACNGQRGWLIHLNPAISFEIMGHSGGGNVRLDLADLMSLTSEPIPAAASLI